jgi:hypothetical protein
MVLQLEPGSCRLNCTSTATLNAPVSTVMSTAIIFGRPGRRGVMASRAAPTNGTTMSAVNRGVPGT